MRQAVFFDRDGTLILESGYSADAARISPVPGAPEAVGRLNGAGYLVVVVSNQSGVARGYFTEEDVANFHVEMSVRFKKGGGRLDAFYFCPHHPEEGVVDEYVKDCDCRKPAPGMFIRAAAELDIDLSRSYAVGDAMRDVQAALAAGVGKAYLVGLADNEGPFAEGVPVVRDVCEAIDDILADWP